MLKCIYLHAYGWTACTQENVWYHVDIFITATYGIAYMCIFYKLPDGFTDVCKGPLQWLQSAGPWQPTWWKGRQGCHRGGDTATIWTVHTWRSPAEAHIIMWETLEYQHHFCSQWREFRVAARLDISPIKMSISNLWTCVRMVLMWNDT